MLHRDCTLGLCHTRHQTTPVQLLKKSLILLVPSIQEVLWWSQMIRSITRQLHKHSPTLD